jgi:hypothetical protein
MNKIATEVIDAIAGVFFNSTYDEHTFPQFA